ncbi:MAG: O-antigen ligase family protein [Solirubrobacterales bacterium]|nr:O-antigen ligase family protein [Solirubrobacterales bacterium]
MALLAIALLVRVLTDNRSSPGSHHSGRLNLSGVIAIVFILLAVAMLARRGRGVLPAILASLWLCIWTAIALGTSGASTETLREGVREGSVIALAVIVYNLRGALTPTNAARMLQFVGFVAAVIAVYQLATDTGMDIAGNIRSNGTFAHPNSAAMFFAIGAGVSLWLYFECDRRPIDVLLFALFTTALLSTYSVDGLAALIAMLIALGALRPGPLRSKGGPWLMAGLIVAIFLATPLGARRIARVNSPINAGANGSSLAWRVHKWKLLMPDWEGSPIIGRGLGTTTTEAGSPGDQYAGEPPHNEYVRYLVESGVVGLAILLWAVTILIRRVLLRRRQWDGRAPNTTALALLVIVGCLVNSLADNTLLDSPTCYAAALIIAALLSVPSIKPGARSSALSRAGRRAAATYQ